MANPLESSVYGRLLNWMARVPTAFHLWCAEQELRIADTGGLTESQKEARDRNLDVLRAYRKRGEFPRHRHDRIRGLPCFIDSDGRQCAVACLMHASGDESTPAKVVREANFARIREMPFLELDAWASESGLTKSELARIQPGYPDDPPQWEDFLYFSNLVLTIWALGLFTILSIFANTLRLFVAFANRYLTSLIGIVAGVTLVGLGFFLDMRHRDPFHLVNDISVFRLLAWFVGMLSVAIAVCPLMLRKPETNRSESSIPSPESLETNTQIKEIKGWN